MTQPLIHPTPPPEDALARRYRSALVRFFSKRLRNDADAEDLAQEVLIREQTHRASEHISFEESGFEG
jgi:DNA-directed RNA polymerase specialized sigma24 family protein